MNVKVELTCYLKMSDGTVVPSGTIFEGETADDLPSDIKKEFVTRSKVLIIHKDGKKETARKINAPGKEEGHSTITSRIEDPKPPTPEKEGSHTVSNDSDNIGNMTDGESGESVTDQNEASTTEETDSVSGESKPEAPVLKKPALKKRK